jgi:hypothetical protein
MANPRPLRCAFTRPLHPLTRRPCGTHHRADMFRCDACGKTALDYARQVAAIGGPPAPAVLLEQAMAAFQPGWRAEEAVPAGAPGAKLRLLGAALPETPAETRELWAGAHRASPLPLPPAAFGKLRAQRPPEPPPPPAVVGLEALLEAGKKRRKRYSSAKERWQSLRESRRRRRAHAGQGDSPSAPAGGVAATS